MKINSEFGGTSTALAKIARIIYPYSKFGIMEYDLWSIQTKAAINGNTRQNGFG